MAHINDIPEIFTNTDGFEIAQRSDFQYKMIARWLINGRVILKPNIICVERKNHVILVKREPNQPYFKLVDEGESKKVYLPLTINENIHKNCIIILKSTIYSHSKQATGYIKDLNKIRSVGSRIFLESIMWRNGLEHTYNSINNDGIISSEYLTEIPKTEIVVKKGCFGTDKHSFYGLQTMKDLVIQDGSFDYKCGPYVRFDWRNPNHIYTSNKQNVNDGDILFENFS